MRYYLDTNILIFLLTGAKESISPETREIVEDYGNLLYTSTVCVHELITLCQIGRVEIKAGGRDISDFRLLLEGFGIRMVPVSEYHLRRLVSPPMYSDNKDPNDRLIVAQAIEDRIALISSDRQFSRYVRHGLDFVYNKR